MKENSLTLHMDSVIPKATDMQQDGFMRCPHLRDWHTACCVAGEGGIVLMSFMKEEYCRSADFRNCPLVNSEKEQHIKPVAEEAAPSRPPAEIFQDHL